MHYPYHSFSSYIKVLREAALSRDVRSIKTTVYRLAKRFKVVKALICAAKLRQESNGHGRTDGPLRRSVEHRLVEKKMQDAGIRCFSASKD